jgi:hypothetical protein
MITKDNDLQQVHKEVAIDCLKILAQYGSYEAGVVTCFNMIAEKYKIDAVYWEYADEESL